MAAGVPVYGDITAAPPLEGNEDIAVMSFNILANNSNNHRFASPVERYSKVLTII